MKKYLMSFILFVSIALLAMPFALQAQPQSTPSIPLDREELKALREQLRATPLTSLAKEGTLTEQGSGAGMVSVVVELDDPSVIESFTNTREQATLAQATSAAQTQLAQIESNQLQMVSRLQSADPSMRVIYRVQRVYNGIAIQVDASKLPTLARLPGVKAIHPLTPKHLSHTSSVSLVGAPQVWAGMSNATGTGIKIGIIDTGIDYIHTNFGGSGLTADYTRNITNSITETPALFPSVKVVGGYDFVGDNYNAGSSVITNTIPVSDTDPMDCNGHGTHIAGTAAGLGVNSDGSTYAGSYNAAIDFDAFRIGPGVAPAADLYALRVFGCDGSTNVTDQAIEWAVDPNQDGNFDDRLDVINMSLGSDYGSPFDTTTIASDRAADLGVIVVAASGNSGDTYYITGSPAVSGRTISVAGSVDSSSVLDGIEVLAPASIAGDQPALKSGLFDWEAAPERIVTGTLVYPPSQRTGCDPFNADNTAIITGNIVLLDWTDDECGSVTRTSNSINAGAIGAILVDNSDVFDLGIAGSDVIPAVSMPKGVGNTLKNVLSSEAVQMVFTSEYDNSIYFDDPTIVDMVYSSSSRGPRQGDSFLKPDIAAPAVTVFSAATGTGNQGASFNGTSMATPHVAGAMALLKQLNPSWTVEELKALVMNTANNDIYTGQNQTGATYGPGRVGAGRLNVPNAAGSQVVAYNDVDDGLVSVSFGVVEVLTGTTATAVKPIRVVNKGTTTVTYTVGYDPRVVMPGVSYSVSPSSLSLAPSASALISVTMTANPTQMGRGARDSTVNAQQDDLPRHWLGEAAGYVTLTPAAAPVQAVEPFLRVPVHAAPRLTSSMDATQTSFDFGTALTGTAAISLTGQGLSASDLNSLVTAFELQWSDPQETTGYTSTADLQYIGLSSDLQSTATMTNPTGVVSETTLYFGVSTYADWSLPSRFFSTWFDILIDTDNSGIAEDGAGAEFRLVNTDFGTATGGDGTDVFVTTLFNFNTRTTSLGDFVNIVSATTDTAPYNNNVLVLPVNAGALGLDSMNSSFNYRVFSYRAEINDGSSYLPVDISAVMTYNVAQPGIVFKNRLVGPAYLDRPSTVIGFDFIRSAFARNGAEGILLLHHHNATGSRAEAITIQGGSVNFIPLIKQNAN
jgi:subtilisin family serine protease